MNETRDKDIVLDELEHLERHRNFVYCRCIKVEEVNCAISKMSKGKMIDPNEIMIEFWRSTDQVSLKCLTCLFNVILKTAKNFPKQFKQILYEIFMHYPY